MTTEKDIIRRNKRIRRFFNFLGFDVIIHGNINTPAIILGNKVLCCYAENFELIFNNKTHCGQELFRYKLSAKIELSSEFISQFLAWLKDAEHRPCYSVGVKNTNLKLAGYNCRDITDRENTKYPVFAQYDYKIYFDKNYALGLVEAFSSEEQPLEVIPN